MDSLDRVYRASTSKGAQRAAINLSLLLGGCIPLLFIATISTALFYRSYMPEQIISVPVYLQYGSGRDPFGLASLADTNLKTQQAYDISVVLSMPLSPTNVERGNFMVVMCLLNGETAPASSTGTQRDADGPLRFDGRSIVLQSRRPALLPYRDPWVAAASRLVFLFYHLVVPKSQVLTLSVPMAHKILLASQQSAMPTAAYVEIQAGQDLQTYETSIVITAQLHGLRWVMHHYRLLSFITATVLFWAAEITFMMLAWLIWGRSKTSTLPQFSVSEGTTTREIIKTEDREFDEFSDVPWTFPTLSKQSPLKYESQLNEETPSLRLQDQAIAGVDADDEGDGDKQDTWRGDSGIGTSYSEAGTGSGVKDIRRRSSNRRKHEP